MRLLRIGALLLIGGWVSSAAGDDGPRPDPTPALAAPAAALAVPAAPAPTPPSPRPAGRNLTVEQVLALRGSVSTSLGGPNDGRIEGAVAIPESGPGFVHNPRRPNAGARFGTVELVQALIRAAADLHRDLPGPEIRINDIGLEHGGDIVHHGSHESGRDVDVLFAMLDGSTGQPTAPKCVPVDPEGNGVDFCNLEDPADDIAMRLDVARTWRFVRALVENDRQREVQRIFLAEHVRTLLLAEAARTETPRRVVQRFGDLTCQPGTPHDDHLHIRFFCTPEDIRRGCQDGAPMYPWRLAILQRAGVEPVMADLRRSRRARSTAAAAAPAVPHHHERVAAFLAARDAWSRQPHPGRPFCR